MPSVETISCFGSLRCSLRAGPICFRSPGDNGLYAHIAQQAPRFILKAGVLDHSGHKPVRYMYFLALDVETESCCKKRTCTDQFTYG
uniref:Uncharacterized protein n=1 Tax=Noccaea caerulescens TaxID=107243 RepID=A0A1J3EC75_NOCCA